LEVLVGREELKVKELMYIYNFPSQNTLIVGKNSYQSFLYTKLLTMHGRLIYSKTSNFSKKITFTYLNIYIYMYMIHRTIFYKEEEMARNTNGRRTFMKNTFLLNGSKKRLTTFTFCFRYPYILVVP
jgi:hypothetical protein